MYYTLTLESFGRDGGYVVVSNGGSWIATGSLDHCLDVMRKYIHKN